MTYLSAVLSGHPECTENELIDVRCPKEFFPQDSIEPGDTGCIRYDNLDVVDGRNRLLQKRRNCLKCWSRENTTVDDVE